MKTQSSPVCLIIGAGISGLLAAQTLRKKGMRAVVLEKSRGMGGRMCTRRHEGAVFDHGSQFFTARSEVFKNLANQWVQAGVARKWFDPTGAEGDDTGHPRYRGVPSMTAPAKTLAGGLDVRRGERIVRIFREVGRWTAQSAQDTRFTADFILITAPVPQALKLFDDSEVALKEADRRWLDGIEYQKTLTLMTILDGPSGLPEEGFIALEAREPVRIVVDNQIKGVSSIPALTVHSGPAFAEQHFEDSEEDWWPLMMNAVFPHLQSKIVETVCHRWRYANPVTSQNESYYLDEAQALALAGDGFGGPRVEGAAYSGILAAEAVAAAAGVSS